VRRGLCVTNAAKPRGSIFTKIRKVLLSFLREPSRSPSPPNAILHKQNYPTQTPFRRRTERCARQSRPNPVLRLPSSCSRALSVAERMRSKRPGAATTRKVSLRRSLLSAERKPGKERLFRWSPRRVALFRIRFTPLRARLSVTWAATNEA
jgi:hypothetical protein